MTFLNSDQNDDTSCGSEQGFVGDSVELQTVSLEPSASLQYYSPVSQKKTLAAIDATTTPSSCYYQVDMPITSSGLMLTFQPNRIDGRSVTFVRYTRFPNGQPGPAETRTLLEQPGDVLVAISNQWFSVAQSFDQRLNLLCDACLEKTNPPNTNDDNTLSLTFCRRDDWERRFQQQLSNLKALTNACHDICLKQQTALEREFRNKIDDLSKHCLPCLRQRRGPPPGILLTRSSLRQLFPSMRHSLEIPQETVRLDPNRFRSRLVCLCCGTSVCAKHASKPFCHQQLPLCLECAPLFDLQFLLECTDQNNTAQIHSMMILYERVCTALKYAALVSMDRLVVALLEQPQNDVASADIRIPVFSVTVADWKTTPDPAVTAVLGGLHNVTASQEDPMALANRILLWYAVLQSLLLVKDVLKESAREWHSSEGGKLHPAARNATPVAGGVLCADKTLEDIRSGRPSDKAKTIRRIQREIKDLPTPKAFSMECRQYCSRLQEILQPKNNQTSPRTVIVEDASDEEYDDDKLLSIWRNRHPSPGQSWMEPIDAATILQDTD